MDMTSVIQGNNLVIKAIFMTGGDDYFWRWRN